MKKDRDELLVIPEQEVVGGFICPICQGVAIGNNWASHAKYCPDCGQHIKIDTEQFIKLRDKVLTIPENERDGICENTVFIGLNGYEKTIAGVYKKRLEARKKDKGGENAQMRMSDYLLQLAGKGRDGQDNADA